MPQTNNQSFTDIFQSDANDIKQAAGWDQYSPGTDIQDNQ